MARNPEGFGGSSGGSDSGGSSSESENPTGGSRNPEGFGGSSSSGSDSSTSDDSDGPTGGSRDPEGFGDSSSDGSDSSTSDDSGGPTGGSRNPEGFGGSSSSGSDSSTSDDSDGPTGGSRDPEGFGDSSGQSSDEAQDPDPAGDGAVPGPNPEPDDSPNYGDSLTSGSSGESFRDAQAQPSISETNSRMDAVEQWARENGVSEYSASRATPGGWRITYESGGRERVQNLAFTDSAMEQFRGEAFAQRSARAGHRLGTPVNRTSPSVSLSEQVQSEYPGLDRGEDYRISERELGNGSTQYAVELTDRGRSELSQPQEQFGDTDWSFGLGGEGDEVERAVDKETKEWEKELGETASALASAPLSGGGDATYALLTGGIGEPSPTEKQAWQTTAQMLNVPGYVSGAMEATETAAYLGGPAAETATATLTGDRATATESAETTEQRTEQFAGAAGQYASESWDWAWANPQRTIGGGAIVAGTLAGGSLAETAAVSRVPALGRIPDGGSAAVRGARAGRDAGRRLHRTVSDSDVRGVLRGSSRGQLDLGSIGDSAADSKTGTGTTTTITGDDLEAGVGQARMQRESRAARDTAGQDSSEPISGGDPWPDYMLPEGHPLRSDNDLTPTGEYAPETTTRAESREAVLDDAQPPRTNTGSLLGVNSATDGLLASDSESRGIFESEILSMARGDSQSRGWEGIWSDTDQDVGPGTDRRNRLDVGQRTRTEPEQRTQTDSEQRTWIDTEHRSDTDWRSRLDLDFGGRMRSARSDSSEDDGQSRSGTLGFDVGGGSSSSGGLSRGSGWLNEFVVSRALGPGPREAASEDALAAAAEDDWAGLTGQLPTEVEVSGTERQQEQIAESRDFLTFDGDDGGLGL